MAVIKAFKGIRPDNSLADKVASLPYDVYSEEEARKAVENNPYSFLRIDRAEVDLPEGTPFNSIKVYNKARDNLKKLIEDQILKKDEEKSMYIYRLSFNDHSQTGLVCLSSVDDYIEGIIKKHELTRTDKEEDRTNHVEICNAHTGPIFLTYRAQKSIDDIITSWILHNERECQFISEDGITHEVWRIDNKPTISTLTNLFSSINSVYIADGHHRAASAVNVALKKRGKNPNYEKDEEFNYFLSVLFPHDQLKILGYHRVVEDLNGLTKKEFFEKLKENFNIQTSETPVDPEEKGIIGMYLENRWYKLKLKNNDAKNLVAQLDVSTLQDYILTPILGIEDVRTSDRIDFVGGIRGLGELEKRCNEDMKIAFSLFPTSIEELMAISDQNQLMPPKSTWFEPKLRSGLFIHDLE